MRPTREPFRQRDQTYFVTFQTAQRMYCFRNERWALELLNTLQRYKDDFDLHDFVIMPDHVHLLLSPHCPLERVVQLIKGGFSFSARRAFEWKGDIWQAGFSDHRIRDEHDWLEHLAYIKRNVSSLRQERYRFCGENAGLALASFPPWLKPLHEGEL
jgi:putative transposase